jgi:hypothetical protein
MSTEHPRFGQRLQVLGVLLAVIGVTAHMQEHRSILLAGGLICLGLLARLTIELSIADDETEEALEPKFRRISFLKSVFLCRRRFRLYRLDPRAIGATSCASSGPPSCSV